MSINKYKPHVFLIPEDDANRQLADGFILHDAVADRALQVMSPAGGWTRVLEEFENVYLLLLRNSPNTHVVMLIDFDEDGGRRDVFEQHTPDDVKSRVFVVGSKDKPETLKRELKRTFEEIGRLLAQECYDGNFNLWRHSHLNHNERDLQRLVDVVKPIVFRKS